MKGLKVKGLKLFAAGAAVASTLGLASAGHAADIVTFAGAGSSALWKQLEQGAVLTAGYPHHYSLGGGAFVQDANGVAGGEKGNIWIAWSGTAGNYTIAYDVQVDSTVGDRAFFRRDTITTTGGAPDNSGYVGTVNPGPPITRSSPDEMPDAEIFTAVQAAAINVGLTDITPADAEVATNRSIKLGYSKTNPIKTDFGTGTTATPVVFSVQSRPYTETRLGAAPVMVFINYKDASGFGAIPTSPAGTASSVEYRNNIDRFTLAGFLSGQLGLTTDLNSDPSLLSPIGGPNAGVAVTTIVREPLSGTYNTMEYCGPESTEVSSFTGGLGQELNWPSTVTHVSGGGGTRRRAIGTGESVKQGNLINNALGYAFWSAANFSSAPNLRYLTVDGVDPLFDNYSTGSFVQGGSPGEGNLQPTSSPTFRNIANGGYPIWSILRAVTDTTPTPEVRAILSDTPTGDFVPFLNLEVFRSYHDTPDELSSADNGHIGSPAAGGDVGGAVFPINTDVNYTNDTGFELTNLRQ